MGFVCGLFPVFRNGIERMMPAFALGANRAPMFPSLQWTGGLRQSGKLCSISPFIPTCSPQPSQPVAEVGWRAQLVAGLRWVGHHRVILENTVSGFVLNLIFAAVTTVFVFYAQHELHFDAARTGLVLGLAGVGPISLAAVAPILRRRFRLGQLLVGQLFVVGPLFALLDVAPVLPPTPALLLVAVSLGLSFGLAILGRIVLRSYVQAAVPSLLLARVNASVRVVAWTGVPVGSILGGTLTQLIGVRWLIALTSGTALLLFLAFALVSETKRI